MKTLRIETVTGLKFEITGEVTQREVDKEVIYYVNGRSFPASIVAEIK